MESTTTPTLPTLDPGVTLLRTDGRAAGPLQSLVLDHLLLADEGATAAWVDARGHAATTTFARIAPSRRVLERVRVARAFTAFQHHSLLAALPGIVTDTTAIVVAPALEWFYASDDLHGATGREMLEDGLATLRDLAATREVSVLLTRHAADGLGDRVAAASDADLACVETAFGPRFTGADVETLVYERDGGTVQTTLAFWRRVLERRHPAHAESTPAAIAPPGTAGHEPGRAAGDSMPRRAAPARPATATRRDAGEGR